MTGRPVPENVATLAVLLICAAFIASFVLGLRGGGPAYVPELPSGGAPAADALPVPAAGRVEVLNASGRAGLARAATDRLRRGGFDVVYFGTATGMAGDSTLILDRTGNDAVARAVARYLGFGIVQARRDTTLFVDATVVIGRDWK